MATVGSQRLAAHIEDKGLRLEDFAEKVGTSKALVSRWRSGEKKPGLKFALRIQQVARIPMTAWLEPVGVVSRPLVRRTARRPSKQVAKPHV